MTIIKNGALLALFGYLIMAVGGTGKPCTTTSLPETKSIFSISPSPEGKDILLYGSREEAEGEIVTGRLFHLHLGGKEEKISRLQVPEASNPPPPVWQADASTAYFQTDQGIYKLDLPSGLAELMLDGPSEGLTISSDGLLLAFWRVGKGSDTLVLYDLKKKAETRTWRIPDRFESEKSGWDLAFAHDGHILYARTYDQAGTTPLRAFNTSNGKVAIVHTNCYAAAEAGNAVYFIGVSGAERSLRKIAGTRNLSSVVAKNFEYDSLSRGGSLRWLVSQNYRTKEVVILDSHTDAIRKIGKHESAAALSDGTLLLIRGNEITINGPSCEDGVRQRSGGLGDSRFPSTNSPAKNAIPRAAWTTSARGITRVRWDASCPPILATSEPTDGTHRAGMHTATP